MSAIELHGNWKAGWALDLHTISSIPLGGGMFDTTYTEIGEALNKLKYHDDDSQISMLAQRAVDFLNTRLVTPYLDAILPVPPSYESGRVQNVYVLTLTKTRTRR